MPLCVYSLVGAGDAMQFGDVIVSTLLKNIIPLILLCIPVVLLCIFYVKKYPCTQLKLKSASIFFGAFIITYLIMRLCINMTGDVCVWPGLVCKIVRWNWQSVSLVLLPSVLLDIKQLIWEPSEDVYAGMTVVSSPDNK